MSAPHKRGYLQSRARAAARRNAVQALYQWEMNQQDIELVISEFQTDRSELQKADLEYFCELLRGVSQRRETLAERLAPHLSRPFDRLDPVERAVLLLAVYELLHRPELPWRVVVNEAIELAKMFGAEQSHRFVNGVLDAAARAIRTAEAGAT
ncbi:MAG: transcription antitermination factor NusB [Gammaproteobacteria bacterium]|nr:transcription antitermination factor NusB [Gammaproteobacteria bacterium]